MKSKILLALISLCFVFSNQVFANGFMEVAKVSKIHGHAFVKASGHQEELKEGAEIAEGMEVTMLKKGDFIEVKFQNGHLVRLVGAKVKVATLNPKNTLFELIKGKIFSAIKPLTENETFVVKTKNVSFAVRGTRYFIDESKKSSYLCVCDGVVAAKFPTSEIDVKKDEDLTVSSKKGELKATPASKAMIDMGNKVFGEMGVI